MSKEIYYSDKYEDDKYEYRHVMLPKVGIARGGMGVIEKIIYMTLNALHPSKLAPLHQAIAKLVPKTHTMSEAEWRNLGVQQSLGWVGTRKSRH